MKLGEAKARSKTPAATLVLPLNCFADEWAGKPGEPICIGLRLLSEEDRRKARKVAEDQALELHPDGGDNWVECYNDAVKRQVIALAMCDPNDVTRPSEAFPYAEDQVIAAFTIRGTQFVFDAVEQLEIDTSPLYRLADRETLQRLARLLAAVDPQALNGRLSRRVSCMLDDLEPLVDELTLVNAGAIDDAGNENPIVFGQKGFVGGAGRSA